MMSTKKRLERVEVESHYYVSLSVASHLDVEEQPEKIWLRSWVQIPADPPFLIIKQWASNLASPFDMKNIRKS
jgi:hypothetical protein